MLSRLRIGIFLVLFLTACFFFLAIPESSNAGVSIFGGPPCCELVIPEQETSCVGGEGAFAQCESRQCLGDADCQFFENRTCEPLDGSEVFGSCQILQTNIPTLGEWGLIALAAVLGAAGYMVIRRKKAAA